MSSIHSFDVTIKLPIVKDRVVLLVVFKVEVHIMHMSCYSMQLWEGVGLLLVDVCSTVHLNIITAYYNCTHRLIATKKPNCIFRAAKFNYDNDLQSFYSVSVLEILIDQFSISVSFT